MNTNARLARSHDQRKNERIVVALAGKLFVPAEEATLVCTVINLSVGGASIRCPNPPPLDAFVVLYVDGFGRFEGVTTHFAKRVLGLKFSCKEAKRKRLEQDLTSFVKEGMVGVTRSRRYPRVDANSTISHFTCADGEPVTCEVLDVSFQGALLKTASRPVIGEVIQLGRTRGWVVRHHNDGIGVQFQQRPAAGYTDGR
jgi:hypothetical protein